MNPNDTPAGRADHMSTTEWLDAVRADLAAATPGPWHAALLGGVVYDDGSSSYRGAIYPARVGAPPIIVTNSVDRMNATLITFAPDRLDRMERALRAVLALHEPQSHTVSALFPYPLCKCGYTHPCPTGRAITEALLGEAGA